MALDVHDGAARELGNHLAELLFELLDVDFDQHGLGVVERLSSRVADPVELRETGLRRDEVFRFTFDGEATRLAYCRQLIFLLRKNGVANLMA